MEHHPVTRRANATTAVVTVAGLAALPYVTFLAANLGEGVDLAVVAGWWAATTVGLGVCLAVVWRVGGAESTARAAVVLAPALWFFFHYRPFSSLLGRMGVIHDHAIVWGMTAAVLTLAALFVSRSRHLRLYFAVLAAALLVPPTVSMVLAAGASSDPSPATASAVTGEIRRQPNIWLLLTDGYARADVVERETDVDMEPFLAYLRERGFDVADGAVANYPLTFLSVASMFQMDYVADVGDLVDDSTRYFPDLNGDNALVRALRSAGYVYALAPAPIWAGSECIGFEDVCLRSAASSLSATDLAIREMTPLNAAFGDGEHPRDVASASDPSARVAQALRAELGRPAFVHMHLLAPHPPFLRDRDCQVRDVSLDMSAPQTREEYGDAVECLNRQLRDAVDAILADDPDAVVIVQSDHGSAMTFDLNRMEPYPDERYAILSAVRLPTWCDIPVPDDLAPVNVFRVVLSCLSGGEVDLLRHREFAAHYGRDTLTPRGSE